MDTICAFLVFVTIVSICIKIGCAVSNVDQERQEMIQRWQEESNGIKKQIIRLKEEFKITLAMYFSNKSCEFQSYDKVYSELSRKIEKMRDYEAVYFELSRKIEKIREYNKELMKESSKEQDEFDMIENCSQMLLDFKKLGDKVYRLPFTKMMDCSNYGRINKGYWDEIHSMSRQNVDEAINSYAEGLSINNYAMIFKIDVDTVLKCVWFYATEKPYSVEAFKKAVSVFKCICKKECVDIMIAQLYAIKQMGGDDVIRERIRNLLKNQYSSEKLSIIASSLMWMKAYSAENTILQHMLNTGMQMNAKMQERLHSLTNGGGNAPGGFDVSSNGDSVYFDVSALTWKEEEYIGLFENLAFQEKVLSYSIAVRDDDKELLITQGIPIPDTKSIFTKVKAVFGDEYGDTVTVTEKNCIALSGSGEEILNGVLAISRECRHMGLFIHLVNIGKKLNIKFYTLFMPNSANRTDQKQQVLSLYKKISPSVTMWENSMKDTILLAIQQILNAATFGGGHGEKSTESSNDTIF